MATARYLLPTADYQGARATGTIKTIEAGTFQTADDRVMQSGAGGPNGTITSHWAGQRYLDTTSRKVWFNPLASDSLNWQQLQNGELLSFNNAAVFHGDEAVTV